MTNRKFSRKRIGQALGLLALGLVLLVGSAGYGLVPSDIPLNRSQADSTALVECKVIALRGDVNIKRVGDDQWRQLEQGDRVQPGDEIITPRNGWVLIVCGCFQVSINPDSHVKLEDFSAVGGESRLIYGTSISRVERCPVGTAVKIMTPRMVLGVRGTLFRVAYDKEKDLSEVIAVKGTVHISTLPTGKNQITLTGPGSCDRGGLRITVNKEEEISEPEQVSINREEWKFEGDGGRKVDFCAP